MEAQWKLLGGGGQGKILEAQCEAKLEFLDGGEGVQNKNLLWGRGECGSRDLGERSVLS